jgi:hypothetical protein
MIVVVEAVGMREGWPHTEGEREGRAVAVWHRPVEPALYKGQWLRILASAPEIEAFIRENESRLMTKE